MRHAKITSGILLIMASAAGCSKSEEPISAAEKATRLMTAASWQMSSLTIDGVVDNTFFQAMKITFTSTTFNATDGDPVWPASATWSFVDASANAFTRSDGLVVSIDELSETKMKLALTWTQTTTSGRVQSVAGKHVFVFSH